MITQVDQATVVAVAIERLLLHPTGQSIDAAGQPGLGDRARDQPDLVAEMSALRDQRLDRGQRDGEVTQPKGNRALHRRDSHRIPPNHAVRVVRTP